MLLVAWPEGFKNGFTDDVYVVWENFLFHKKCSHYSTYVAQCWGQSWWELSLQFHSYGPSGPSMIFCYDRCAASSAAAASSRSSCIAPLRLVLGQKSRQTVGNNDDASRQIRSGYLCSAAGWSQSCLLLHTYMESSHKAERDRFLFDGVCIFLKNQHIEVAVDL